MDLKIFIIRKLKADLIKFGLNPKEWIVGSRELDNSLLFENKFDKNFRLLGILSENDHGLCLKELSLFSI